MPAAILAKLIGLPKWGQWLIIGSLLFLVGTSSGAAIIQTIRIDGFLWIDGLADKLADRDKTIAEMIAAQATAKAEQERVNDENEQRQAELARRADNAELEAGELRRKVDGLRAASDRFANARGMRGLCEGAPGRSGAPAQGDPADDRDGPGADLVVLTRPEYEEAVANSIRLERVRQWGQSLITEGLAIPVAEFGQPSPATDR